MSQTEKPLPYGKDFQLQILAFAARDPSFLANYRDVFIPGYFENFECRTLCELICEAVDEYPTSLPSQAVLSSLAVDRVHKLSYPDATRKAIFKSIDFIYESDLSNADYFKETIGKFGRRQAISSILEKILTKLEKDNDEFEAEIELFRKSIAVGTGIGNKRFDFTERLLELPVLLNEDHKYGSSAKIPWGLRTLDRVLGGGMAPGELGVVMGYSGRGKSFCLVNAAATAYLLSKPVVFYTFELQEIDVAARLASRISGIPINEIRLNQELYNKQIIPLLSAGRCPALTIKYFPPKSVGVSALRSDLSLVCERKQKPSLVVVDYADKLRGSRSFGDTYNEMGDVYENLIAMGHDFDVPVLTASQIQRGAKSESDDFWIDLDAVADSFRKMTDADVVLTMNQTNAEYKNNKLRLYGAKIRRGTGGLQMRCEIDYARAHIRELEEEPVEEATPIESEERVSE